MKADHLSAQGVQKQRSPLRQLSFETNQSFQDFKKRAEHGAHLRKGRRKLSRPFDSSKALHLVLRSTKAKGSLSFLRAQNERAISQIIYKFAKKNHVTVFKYANSGNHLHLLLKASTKRGFQAFLKTITGLIARHVTGAKKGKQRGKFWDGLAYTKLISWGRQFKATVNYVWRNALEGWGVIPQRQIAKGQFKIDYLTLYD